MASESGSSTEIFLPARSASDSQTSRQSNGVFEFRRLRQSTTASTSETATMNAGGVEGYPLDGQFRVGGGVSMANLMV